jgi:hypothetical protein
VGDDSVRCVEQVDAAWLTGVLRETRTVPDDVSIEVVRAVPIGTGQVGDNVRFELVWSRDDPALPPSVVGKFPSRSEVSRATAVQVGTYVREVGFYRDLQSRVDICTPVVHHVGWDPVTHDFVIVMGDLRASHPGDQLAGCDVGEAERVVAEVVGLHAPTWGRVEALRGLDWLGHPGADRAATLAMMYAATLPGFVDRYGGRLGREVVTIAERVVGASERLSALTAEWAEGRGAWCVAHGDFRLDNILFGDAAGEPPVTVVDWQTVTIGTGIADVAYFVGSGLLPDVRAAHERRLVERYVAAMRRAGVELDDEVAWDGYVLGSAGGLLMAVVASQIVEQTERGDEMFMTMAARHAVQIDAVGLLGRL